MQPEAMIQATQQSARMLKERLGTQPVKLAVVGGSGLGDLIDIGRLKGMVPYEEIPQIGRSGVQGHAGSWNLLEVEGGLVYFLAGRRHMYEGIEPWQAGLSMRLLKELGVERVLLTNAAGGLATRLQVGDLMLLSDHINLMGRNPLVGPHDERWGARFPDMSEPYSRAMRADLQQIGQREGIALQEGVYVGLLGPNYETRAEVEMLRRLGGDAVGMSTVPEALVAVQAGLKVAAVSLITNSHVNPHGATTHDEVLEVGRAAVGRLKVLFKEAIKCWSAPGA